MTLSQPAFDTLKNQIICTDALTLLRGLPSDSINCIVTSPPYFGLRDYGVAGQIGLEKSPAEYVATMVELFREARRVLKADGTLWLNLGDSYANDGIGGYQGKSEYIGSKPTQPKNQMLAKNLMMIPARVAIALQDDGWYLRSEIIWHKPNAMPESVKDRPTKAHEMVYLLTKSPSYWYDWEAIAEPLSREYSGTSKDGGMARRDTWKHNLIGNQAQGKNVDLSSVTHRNKRTVWTVSTKPFSEAHFATFPTDLIEPMIKAGCPFGGIVLDPFMGSGTTALVARELGRHYIGSELNPSYIEIAKKRLSKPYAVDMFLGIDSVA